MSPQDRLTVSVRRLRTRSAAAVLAAAAAVVLLAGCAMSGSVGVGGNAVRESSTATSTPISPATKSLSAQRIVFSWNTGSIAPEYAYRWTLTLTGTAGSVTLWRNYSQTATSTSPFTVAGPAATQFWSVVAGVVQTGCGPDYNEGDMVGGPYGAVEVTADSVMTCMTQLGANSRTAGALDSLEEAALSIIPQPVSATFKP